MGEEKHPGGRPTLYKPIYAEQAEKLCKLGATDMELADFFEVNVATLQQWKLLHQEFHDSIKVAKEPADERVKRSLYHRATGYSYATKKIFNGPGGVVEVPDIVHVPPDVTAQQFWLRNRCKDEFRDKQETSVTGPNDGPIKTENVVYSGVLAEEDKNI